MNQTSLYKGAAFMVLAGMAFAAANGISSMVIYGLGFKPESDAFWQYAIAFLFSLPFVWKMGLAGLKTRHPVLHIVRVLLSSLGVIAFAKSFAYNMPIWHIVALVMTSPFFVLIGAATLLGEKVNSNRWIAATIGFAGAMVLLRPWDGGLNEGALFPIAAAIFWGAASLITKRLTREEPQSAITMWLLVLLAPINGLFSIHAGFQIPTGEILALLVIGGVLMFAAQHFLTLSYSAADAAVVQPFDDLKLFSNIAVSWFLGQELPTGAYWLGIALILAGSAYLLWSERRPKPDMPQMA